MSCAPIDTDGPRFYVSSIEGYPITQQGTTAGNAKPTLVRTVIDSFYGTEHGRFASDDLDNGRGWEVARRSFGRRRGREGALAAAAERCAELNAWHEREGWEDDPDGPDADVMPHSW